MKVTVFVLVIAGILSGCAGTEKTRRPEVHFQDWESHRLVPMRNPSLSLPGVTYIASEQFLLCRREDACPVPEEKFTERFLFRLPEPVREEPIVRQPQILKQKLSEPIPATVFFDKGDATLTEKASKVLDGMFDQIKEVDPLTFRIVVAGYTDGTGSSDANARLAKARAEAISDYFVQKGIPDGRIITGGRPLCCYVASNDTEEGRAKNRRVDIFVEPVKEEEGEKKN